MMRVHIISSVTDKRERYIDDIIYVNLIRSKTLILILKSILITRYRNRLAFRYLFVS